MIKLQAKGSDITDILFVSKAEAKLHLFYNAVLVHYQGTLKKLLPDEDIRVMFVVGSDAGWFNFTHLPWSEHGTFLETYFLIPQGQHEEE